MRGRLVVVEGLLHGLGDVGGPDRPLLDGRGRRDVTPPDARHLADLDLDAVAVALVELGRSARPRRAASTTGRGRP